MSHERDVPAFAAAGRLALSEAELIAWGERLGRNITAPLVITIEGELGAGKTTLTRAICRGYGVVDEVTSPTFTLVHEYQGGRSKVFHLDLYRLKSEGELDALAWDDMLRERAVIIVEWPDRAGGQLPKGHIPISLWHIDDRPDCRILYAGGHT